MPPHVGIALLLATEAPTSPPQVDDPQNISVTWTAPTSCPPVDRLRERLAQLRHSNDLAWPTALDVLVEHDDSGLHRAQVRIHLATQTLERTYQARDCTVVVEAMATSVAVAARTPVVVPEPEPTNPPETTVRRETARTQNVTPPPRRPKVETESRPAEPSDPPSEPAVVPERAPTRTFARTWRRFSAALTVAGGWGVLPSVSAGFGARFEFRARWLLVGLGASYWLPRTAPLTGGVDGEASFDAWTGGVDTCVRFARGRWELPICASARAGVVLGDGSQAPNPTPGRAVAPWVAVGGTLMARWQFRPRFGAALQLTGLANLERPQFALFEDQDTPVHLADLASLRGVLSVSYAWGPPI